MNVTKQQNANFDEPIMSKKMKQQTDGSQNMAKIFKLDVLLFAHHLLLKHPMQVGEPNIFLNKFCVRR